MKSPFKFSYQLLAVGIRCLQLSPSVFTCLSRFECGGFPCNLISEMDLRKVIEFQFAQLFSYRKVKGYSFQDLYLFIFKTGNVYSVHLTLIPQQHITVLVFLVCFIIFTYKPSFTTFELICFHLN